MAQPYAPLIQQMLLDFKNQRLEPAERLSHSILRINPKDPIALQVQGLCMAMQGRLAESIVPFSKASSLDPKNPELLSNLAKAQHESAHYSDAITTYQKLDRLIPNNAQILTDMGTSYAKSKDYESAARCYDRALELQPNYFLAWSNKGNLLADLQSHNDAILCFDKALELNPNYPEAWTNRGNSYFYMGQLENALQCHNQAIQLDPNYAEALSNCANTLTALNRNDEAFLFTKRAFEIKPNHPYLLGNVIAGEMTLCHWQASQPLLDGLFKDIQSGKPASIPFHLLSMTPSLELQLQCAQIFVRERVPQLTNGELANFKPAIKDKQAKIRIGYFSSDFRDHPVGILMQNIVKLHNRELFEIYGFFLNQPCSDLIEANFLKAFDKSFKLFGLTDEEAVELVRAQNIDIAVDLNAHTANGRINLFSKVMAPVQVNYLGYAGTSGADFYDYLIADEVAIPRNHFDRYTEKIAHLPNSFFPVDSSIPVEGAVELPTRANQDLPENGFIFTCFNNAYKISPEIFDVWMSLLIQTPQSVLWLSKPSADAMKNLKEAAAQRGVDPNRLVFAKRVPARVDHLSRLRLADLFLDTPNYNAHATAGDALWAGVPVLTVAGSTFSGRVAASQVNALGLSELIVESLPEYESKALDLTQPGRIAELKQRISEARKSSPLFDTRRYVKDLENLYQRFLNERAVH